MQERTSPSNMWIMPKKTMWGPDEVLLQSQNLNITTSNYEQVKRNRFELKKCVKDSEVKLHLQSFKNSNSKSSFEFVISSKV